MRLIKISKIEESNNKLDEEASYIEIAKERFEDLKNTCVISSN